VGWWNGIAGRDFDHDGDIDYVVTNFGLNTKYHASPQHPSLLYYGDFANSGQFHLVEAEYEDETLFPVRGKSCSTTAMPFLAERFPTYRDFASASLHDIYTTQCLEKAHRFAVNTLESGLLVNDGRGRFAFRPLPRLAQASPGFGVVATEINGDSHPDIYIAQNFFAPQPETGQMDGGLSLLLQGNGDGSFVPVEPARSGLLVPEDAKAVGLADFNADHCPDLLVSTNNDLPHLFQHANGNADRLLAVRLKGRIGNPLATGARITVRTSDGREQTAELYAGGGYLGQSAPVGFFGVPESTEVESVQVHWPDARVTSIIPDDVRQLLIEQPTE
jgi:hypothetical protein